MRVAVHLAALCAFAWATAVPIESASPEADFGPLYSHQALTLAPGERTEALGPFFSVERAESELTWAIPPLISEHRDATTDFSEYDVLYPLFTYDRYGKDYRAQLLQLFSFSGGANMELTNVHRVNLFPFFFRQRSPDPALNYTAVVPFYGHIQNHFFRDDIRFVMLPLYLRTQKHEVTNYNYLAPFFSYSRGNQLRGWQFWPLAGHEHKEPTLSTNLYQETETVPGHDKLFALWPIYFRNDLGLGTTNLETQRLLLPLYSIQHSPQRDTTSILWPLGYTHTVDREQGYREWALPWPLVDFARGKGKTLNRVWPVFSQGKTPTLESDFYLWPLYKYNRVQAEPLDQERTRILFFLYSDLLERNTTAKTSLHRTDLWPLFTARKDHAGNERLQLLAPIEPLLPNNPGIERNFSPLWSLWRSEKNGKTGASSASFLWNLYRYESDPEQKKFSLLFGLIHYQSGPDGIRWRLFYVPLGRTAAGTETAASFAKR